MLLDRQIAKILRAVGDNIPPEGKRDYFRLHRHRFHMLLAAIPLGAGSRALEIGVNPVKPAEFVIIRIGQWSGGGEKQES